MSLGCARQTCARQTGRTTTTTLRATMLSRHHGTTGPASSELAIRLGLLPRLLGEESKGMDGFPWEDVAQVIVVVVVLVCYCGIVEKCAWLFCVHGHAHYGSHLHKYL